MTEIINVPQILNRQAASALYDDLVSKLDSEVEIDVSEVRHVGAQALQVLISAHKTWAKSDATLSIVNQTAVFEQCLRTLGAQEHLSDPEIEE